jgi:hypothetical protein
MSTTLPTQLAGINIETLSKGDHFTAEQAEHAYRIIDPKLDENIERFNRGELFEDPRKFIAMNLVKHIERVRLELHDPVVCRTEKGGVHVLTDAEAVDYLNGQANAGLRKHKAKTTQMFSSVDVSALSDHQTRQLEANQRRHAFVLASHQGARREALQMGRRGLSLPDYAGRARQKP